MSYHYGDIGEGTQARQRLQRLLQRCSMHGRQYQLRPRRPGCTGESGRLWLRDKCNTRTMLLLLLLLVDQLALMAEGCRSEAR